MKPLHIPALRYIRRWDIFRTLEEMNLKERESDDSLWYSYSYSGIYLSIYLSTYGSTVLVELVLFFSVLIYTQSVGLLGRVISPSQGRYLHRTTQTQNKHTKTSMTEVGFEPTIQVFERVKRVNALDRAATVIGCSGNYVPQMTPFWVSGSDGTKSWLYVRHMIWIYVAARFDWTDSR
jgi:hypothetical protein